MRAAEGRIFVSIASYADPLLGNTLSLLFKMARHPEHIFVGVCEQAEPDKRVQIEGEWMARHVRRICIEPAHSRGCGWARAVAASLYMGEEWVLQIDAHTWFEPGWDERLIQKSIDCYGFSPNVVLSSMLPGFYVDAQGLVKAQPATGWLYYSVLTQGQQIHRDYPILTYMSLPVSSPVPMLSFHVCGHFVFAPGRWLQEVPPDPLFYFYGEEQSLTLRSYTRGWDLFHPASVPLYHQYKSQDSNNRPLHWQEQPGWQRLELQSRHRLRALIDPRSDLGCYGLGTARNLSDYAHLSGIDYERQTIRPVAYGANLPVNLQTLLQTGPRAVSPMSPVTPLRDPPKPPTPSRPPR